MRMRLWLSALVVGLMVAKPVTGHGRLIEPPSRASAWRFGFPTPHNYNDHELYCGGFSRQWHKNGGNCGICGDAWDQKTPRPHEFGGRFGLGVIVRKYKVNSVIDVQVDLTANHNGYFEFRMCPYMENTTQECLDRHVLQEYKPDGDKPVTKYYPKNGNQVYSMQYKLPQDLLCEHCVLQWKYIAGNNWGTCPDGSGAVGCGPQEEFRACSDVAIGLKAETVIPGGQTTIRPRPPYITPTRRTTTPSGTSDASNATSTESPMPEEEANAWVGIIIAVLMLFLVLLGLTLVYFYYYHGGHRIKALLMKKNPPPVPQPPPVRPPRTKRTVVNQDESTRECGVDIDNNIEPGFETIKLGKY